MSPYKNVSKYISKTVSAVRYDKKCIMAPRLIIISLTKCIILHYKNAVIYFQNESTAALMTNVSQTAVPADA